VKEQLHALKELQDVDVRLGQVKARLDSLGDWTLVEKKCHAVKAALDNSQEKLAKSEIELKDSELKLKTIEDKRATFEKRLYGGAVSNPKELSAIEKEIKMLKHQQADLDQGTLELYEAVEEARGKVGLYRDHLEKLESKLSSMRESEESERESLEKELAELERKRGPLAGNITDKALYSRYENVRKKTEGTGLAEVIDGKCQGCHVAITSFHIRKMIEDKEYQCCESCGRIMLLVLE